MALELRVEGPELNVVRQLEAGEPELVLGRDADCDICLPDPQRNVSRRHLSIWLEDGELRFHVLSVVNGIELPFGEAPPGARGVLPAGQTLRVGDYSVCAASPAPVGASSQSPSGLLQAGAPEDDPFGDWGFETTFAPGAATAGRLEAGSPGPGGMAAFFQGLGLDPASVGALSDPEFEAIGRLVRILMLGVLELDASASGAKQEMNAEDRTVIADRDDNPLKTGLPEQAKLRYMFGGRAAGAGFVNPERALRELLGELIAHNGASGAAARAALESTLREFAPAALKSRLLPSGARLFEGARAWDAYRKYYAHEAQDVRRWAQRLLDRYFAETYLRESRRIRREAAARRHDGGAEGAS